MSKQTMEYCDTLVTITCWCGINHAVPQALQQKQQRDFRDGRKQTSIYCPLGHSHILSGEGEAAKLRRQLERERDWRVAADAAREQAEASASAYKGQATRARRRAAVGVCPCCGRSFVQVRRHMAAKHPEYLAEHGIEADPDPKAAKA